MLKKVGLIILSCFSTFLCNTLFCPQGGAIWHLWDDRPGWKWFAQPGGIQFLWTEDQWREVWQGCLGCLQRWLSQESCFHKVNVKWIIEEISIKSPIRWCFSLWGTENFDMIKNQLTRQGFMELNLMEATEKDGDPTDLWVTLEAMGYNRMLELSEVSFHIWLNSQHIQTRSFQSCYDIIECMRHVLLNRETV